MLKKVLQLFLTACLLLLVVNCAKRGAPTGGPEDEDPPVFVKAEPPNYSTNFEGDEIRIYFDEYIKLKELQKQLIISPPMNPAPLITPLGNASKYITIEIIDTLAPNTTYVFNFGRSVVDNNEENPYSYFKYVMSTGDFIDSLSVKGTIVDALLKEPDEFVTVMLYEVDSTYSDSAIFKSTPRYVTNTLDSTTTFELSNLREGRYQLAALKDEDNNFTFQPAKDKVAFLDHFINVPTDSSYTLTLFKEEPAPTVERPRFAAAQRISFPYKGNVDSVNIELLGKPAGYRSLISTKKGVDTLRYWYSPQIEADSLIFEVRNLQSTDTLIVRKRKLKQDSLFFNAITRGTLKLRDTFKLESSIPVVAIDTTLINVKKSDSIDIDFTTQLSPRLSQITVGFETEENQSYSVEFLPNALTDFYGAVNDSLSFRLATKEYSDYGEMELTLQGADQYPYIIQIVTEQGDVLYEQYGTEGQSVFKFDVLEPGQYYVRLIVDKNENGVYDTGNFLEKRQPEEIIYYPKLLDIRSGWLPKETFILDQPQPELEVQTDPDPLEN